MQSMTAISGRFRAYVAERVGDRVKRGLRIFDPADLPAGEVEIRVAWSCVNYKDALATRADGKVARISPLIPGIDLAGVVGASADSAFAPGDRVIAHGYDLGVSRHGGYAEYARVPAEQVVPLPAGLSLRESMALGTAGFTAALSVMRLEDRGLDPADGPVLVTGATGGVGSTAVSILAGRGYEVWALTGKADEHAWLQGLGAVGFLGRTDAPANGPPLEKERWAAVVDPVGAATLPYGLRSLRRGGAVALSGNAGGAALVTTVFPFILRGVALLGIDSAYMPIEDRRRLWDRLSGDLRPASLGDRLTEVTLDTLDRAFDAILAGQARGRWVVRIGGDG
jgi:acrylyl-CoA reductase (NADPH)